MGILDRRKGKALLNETRIYERFENWFKNEDARAAIEELKERIKDAKEEYQRELIKECRQKDFLRTFIVMCDLACQNINTNEERNKIDLIKNMVGYIIGDIIFETTDITKLNEILKELERNHSEELMCWINDHKYGKVWILDTFIDSTTKKVLSKKLKEHNVEEIPTEWTITFGDVAKYDFALFSGASIAEVESMLAHGISRRYFHNILYGFIMLRLLMDALKDDLYVTWLGDEDLFTGYSGVNHFFDGVIVLEKEDEESPWLLKCISTYYTPSDAIESIETKLDDMGMEKCILFVPTYPSQNALRHLIYTYTKTRHEVIILYLHDLYKMLGMKDDEIKGYLMRKVIR